MRHEDKPSTPGEALEHHGVKGMRWGHRKKEDTGDGEISAKPVSAGSDRPALRRVTSSTTIAKEAAKSNSSLKRMMAASAELDRESKPSEANFISAKQDWLNKFAPDGPTPGQPRVAKLEVPKQKKKLTPAQKQLLKGALIGGGAIGAAYLLNRQLEKSLGINSQLKEHLKKGTLRGKPISAEDFNNLTTYSKLKSWSMGNYVRPQSWEREGFELPVGHEFLRLSQQAESVFNKPTYSVASQEDWNRYLTNFRHEKGPGASLHQVSWKLTEPVKVPALKDVIGTMQEVLKEEGMKGTEKEAIRFYNGRSGKTWTDARSKKLVEALKKKGYGALVDEMDAGVIGDKPLVFFAHDSATSKVSKPLTAADIAAAEAKVKELSNRKS